MNKYIVIGLMGLALVFSANAADKLYTGVDDTSVAFSVAVPASMTGSASIVVAAGGTNVTVQYGATTSTFNPSTYTTLTLLAMAIESNNFVMNGSTSTWVTVSSDCLLADSVNNTLLAGTYTAAPGNPAEVYWDSSLANFYQITTDGGTIKYLYGNFDSCATNYTVSVYNNGTQVYVGSATTTTTDLDEDFGAVGLPCQGKTLIRSTISLGTGGTNTTVSSGIMGAVIEK